MGEMKLEWHPPTIPHIMATHSYSAEYSAAVHEGAEFKTGWSMPARPWVTSTVRECDFAQMVADEMPSGGRDIEDALTVAFKLANERLGELFDDAILDEKWAWNGLTRRANGDLAGYIRDIYDTGELYRSRDLEFS